MRLSTEIGTKALEDHHHSFAVIKVSEVPLEISKPIASQVQVISVNGGHHHAGSKAEEGNHGVLHSMQQVTKHMLNPLAKVIRSSHDSNQVLFALKQVLTSAC